MTFSIVDTYLRGIAIDQARIYEEAEAANQFDRLQELDQQLQLTISGSAGSTLAWQTFTVVFDVEFINATYQRYSNLTDPHFTYGVEVTSSTPVLVTACVKSWTVDTDRGSVITGCVVAVGVVNPGATAAIAFTGRVHLNFQGYGAVSDGGNVDIDG